VTQVKLSYAPAQGSVSCLRNACVLVVPAHKTGTTSTQQHLSSIMNAFLVLSNILYANAITKAKNYMQYEVRNKDMEVNQSSLSIMKFKIGRHVVVFIVFFNIGSDQLFSNNPIIICDYPAIHQENI
jgi:hypothetical protein